MGRVGDREQNIWAVFQVSDIFGSTAQRFEIFGAERFVGEDDLLATYNRNTVTEPV